MTKRLLFLFSCVIALTACPAQTQPAPQTPPQQGYGYPPQPPPGYGQQPYPPQQQLPPAQQAQQNRPLLAPLYPQMWQPEARAVLAELITHLDASSAQKVNGMPLQIDPDPTQVNAYATCTDAGAPFVAITEGLLEAVDGIAQTRATDELFGTQTYATYANAVIPALLQPQGRAALPPGIIPAQYLNVPQRLSRAHEMFDDIIAFTVGHEISHHYLGHTGCTGTVGPIDFNFLGRIISQHVPLPVLNQPNETAADTYGCWNALDTGIARAPNYRWSEKGGLMLLQFLAQLESAEGATPLNPLAYFQSHPSSPLRIVWVQGAANSWYARHASVPR